MHMTVSAQGFELTDAIEAHAQRELLHALDAFGADVHTVTIFVRDTNGPKGGVDKRVLIRVELPGCNVVAVESVREDLYGAISDAARRTRRVVKRALAKSRRLQRHRLRRLRLALGPPT